MVKSSNFMTKLWRKIIPEKNAKFSFSSPRNQSFSLPYNFIEYIRKNPISPNGLQKLQQTCRYFFAKQKILVIKDIFERTMGRIFIQKELNSAAIQRLKRVMKSKKLKKKLNFENVLLWFTNSIYLNGEIPKEANCLYRIDIQRLSLYAATVPWKFIEILASSNINIITDLSIVKSQIISDDGSSGVVPLNVVLQKFPDTTKLNFRNAKETFSKDALQKLNALQFKNKLKAFSISLYFLPTSFDYQLFTNFIHRCCDSSSYISLNIAHLPSDELDFIKIWLENLKDELMATDFHISTFYYD